MMRVELPERVLEFTSTNMPEPEVVLGYLPKDTSYASRRYVAATRMGDVTVILMGADRTSIHRPDYCLPARAGRSRQDGGETEHRRRAPV